MTSLPVINADETHVISLYRRATALWSSHVADEAVFSAAGVYANGRLKSVPEANCIIGELSADRVADVLAYFADANTAPLQWSLPGGDGRIQCLTAHPLQLWRLSGEPADLPQTHDALTIIPARASFSHVKQFAAIMRPALAPEEAGEAAMSHLDDAHVDAIIALHQSEAAGYASVISTGETGFIMELFVREDLRRQGYGSALAGRILDICARSLFRQVYCTTEAADERAARFTRRVGFTPERTIEHFHKS